MSVSYPHDKFCRRVFSNEENARGELQTALPASLVRAIDWATLKLEDGHFVDPELAGSQSDLLFTVWMQGVRVFLYVLFEHQSTVDALMPLRLLGYMGSIWDRWLSTQSGTPEHLPGIIPVVLSHDERGWRAATSMHALFDPALVVVVANHGARRNVARFARSAASAQRARCARPAAAHDEVGIFVSRGCERP
jgi:hypothetical protein